MHNTLQKLEPEPICDSPAGMQLKMHLNFLPRFLHTVDPNVARHTVFHPSASIFTQAHVAVGRSELFVFRGVVAGDGVVSGRLPLAWCTSRSKISTRPTRPSPRRTAAVTARSLRMQKPEPASGNAWCVPPAVLHARPCISASRAVSSVPEQPQADFESVTNFEKGQSA